ncbi:MAG: entry exclusion lipoprotein TrbK [Methylococcaceae bacterium]
MNYKYITIAIFVLLIACTQEPQETAKPTDSLANAVKPPEQQKAVPEVNDANCQFEYMKSITDKHIQQTLADNCMRRNTLQPPVKHKNWTIR